MKCIPIPDAEGPMPCSPEDIHLAVELANRVFRPNSTGDMGAEYPLLFSKSNAQNLLVVKARGRVISLVGLCIRDAAILGYRIRTVSVGSVCTDPAFRGRGLASALMHDAIERSRSQGCSLMLISGDRSLYRRLGAVPVTAFQACTVAADCVPAVSGVVQVFDVEAQNAPILAGLYQREPVRFRRSMDDWRALLGARMLMNRPADFFTAEQDGVPTAYVCVQRPGRDGIPAIREYAGSRCAVRLMLPWICRRYSADAVDLTLMPGDLDMFHILQAESLTVRPQSFDGTVCLIDPPVFFGALTGLVSERVWDLGLAVSWQGEEAVFTLGAESLVWRGLAEITARVFEGIPADAQPSPLITALRSVFPVPLLWYGLNYV
ncbi:MAG: GNAT family N-acetyltransferase [Armatimonadota bacterium]